MMRDPKRPFASITFARHSINSPLYQATQHDDTPLPAALVSRATESLRRQSPPSFP